jgi:hypothetical protein
MGKKNPHQPSSWGDLKMSEIWDFLSDTTKSELAKMYEQPGSVILRNVSIVAADARGRDELYPAISIAINKWADIHMTKDQK